MTSSATSPLVFYNKNQKNVCHNLFISPPVDNKYEPIQMWNNLMYYSVIVD